jgi:ABC-2 type transport system ATP-binding protein
MKIMTNEVIVTENLSKSYAGFTALDKLNLKVTQNTCVGYLGPNGSGKSTTIKILTGLLKPTSGRAFLNGFDVVRDTRRANQDVGAVVETPEFYPYLNPQEILEYFGKLRGMSKGDINSRTNEVLEIVRLSEWRTKKVRKFSKGMKQRLAIASALLHDPSIIIVDEVTSGLDPRGMIEIRDIIKSLKKNDKTIFMSSHLLAETQEICDKVALIDKGKLLRLEDVSNIGNISKNYRIQIELIEMPTKSQIESINNLPGVEDVKHELTLNLIVTFKGGLNARADLLDQLHELGLRIVTFKQLDSDLESLYLDLVSQSVG